MSDPELYRIISKSLINSLTEKEHLVLNNWLNEHPDNRILFDIIESKGMDNFYKREILGSEEAKSKIWEKLEINNRTAIKRSSFGFAVILKYAAVLLLLITTIYGISRFNISDQKDLKTNQFITKSNPKGQKTTITLSDGTMINLNANSSISYYTFFTDSSRIVNLIGEAFFDVMKDTLRPFYVYSDGICIEAVGTSFNVRNFSNSNNIQVSLSSGKLKVEDQTFRKQLVELSSGEQVSYIKNENKFSSVSFFDQEEVEGWRSGNLIFKSADIENIESELESWYGVELEYVTRSFKPLSYTGSFKRQNLENVLTSMGYALNFEFKIIDRNVYVKFKNDDMEKKQN